MRLLLELRFNALCTLRCGCVVRVKSRYAHARAVVSVNRCALFGKCDMSPYSTRALPDNYPIDVDELAWALDERFH